MSTEPGASRKGLLLKMVVTALVIAILIYTLDWGEIWDVLRTMDRMWLAAASASYFAITILESGRLYVVFRYLSVGAWQAYMLQAIGLFWASFMPGQFGGDVYRVVVLRAIGGTVLQSVSALIVLRVIAFGVIAASSIVATAMVWGQLDLWSDALADATGDLGPNRGLTIAVVCLAAIFAALVAVLVYARSAERLRYPKRWVRGAARELIQLNPRDAVVLILLSGFTHLNRVLITGLLLRAAGVEIDWDVLLFVTSLVTLANQIPVGFAGLGTREAALIALLAPVGVEVNVAAAVAIANRAIVVIFALWGGALFAFLTNAFRRADSSESS